MYLRVSVGTQFGIIVFYFFKQIIYFFFIGLKQLQNQNQNQTTKDHYPDTTSNRVQNVFFSVFFAYWL